MDGYGVMSYRDGRIYEGEFRSDMKQGPGIIRYPNGQYIKGIWQMDEMKTALTGE